MDKFNLKEYISKNPLLNEGPVEDFEDVTLGPISCGPPRVSIRGGYGCKANPIVSQSGRVVAVDVVVERVVLKVVVVELVVLNVVVVFLVVCFIAL